MRTLSKWLVLSTALLAILTAGAELDCNIDADIDGDGFDDDCIAFCD